MQTTAISDEGDSASIARTADDTIRRAVKALIGGRDTDSESVAAAIGMVRSTFYRRLAGHGAPFTGGEVQAIADHFGVPVADLFSGLGGAIVPHPERHPPLTRSGYRP
jgi:hypothetical protein